MSIATAQRLVLATAAILTIGAAAPDDARKAAWLEAHNKERAAVGAPPLVWDDALAARAARWADTLARTRRFDHEDQDGDGENLWEGTKGYYPPAEMVQAWIDEKSLYKPNRFPDVSTSGQWLDVGHYTQLIWAKTTRLGCALRSNAENDILVCRYDPPGNWIGQFAVPAPAIRTKPAKISRSGSKRKK